MCDTDNDIKISSENKLATDIKSEELVIKLSRINI